eukprot:365702-Chlamydomonas_euryale.AAC.32
MESRALSNSYGLLRKNWCACDDHMQNVKCRRAVLHAAADSYPCAAVWACNCTAAVNATAQQQRQSTSCLTAS